MSMALVNQPVAWIIVLLALVLCWPLAQSLRHEQLRPVAAYLLFTSVLVLVTAPVFLALAWIATLLLPAGAAGGTVTALVTLLLSLLPGLAAARWIVRRPQNRRMPR